MIKQMFHQIVKPKYTYKRFAFDTAISVLTLGLF